MDEFRTVNVLLLHGLRGWGKRMVKRMQEVLYRHPSLNHIYLDYVDAPGGQGNWGYDVASYGTKIDPTCVKASVEASVQLVEAKIQEAFLQGHPFHAVLGYSQGASLAALVAAKLCKTESGKNLQWILISGDPSFLVELGIEELIPAPSLHIAGINDLTVPFYESSSLRKCFESPRFYEHPGGHEFLPAAAFLHVAGVLGLTVDCCWCGKSSTKILDFHMFHGRTFCNTCWVAYGGPHQFRGFENCEEETCQKRKPWAGRQNRWGQFYCYDCWEAWDAQSTEASETLGLKGKLDESEELGEKSLPSGKVCCDVKIGPKSTFWAGIRG